MSNIKGIFTAILTVTVVGNIFGQGNSSLTLSLKEAEQYAIDHNRSLTNATLDVKIEEAARWQTIASMLPQVNGAFDYQNYCGYNMNLMGINVPMNPSGTLGLTAAIGLSAAQVVGSTLGTLAIDMAKITVNKSDMELRNSVDQIYLSILVMEKTVELLDSSLINLENLYKITQNSVNVGAAEQTDADQISVQVASMKNSINSSKRSLEMLYNSLRLQLGCDVEAQITLTDPIETIMNIQEAQNLLNTHFDLKQNFDYQLLQKSSLISKRQITMSAMDYVPSISMFYQYSYKTYFGKDEGMNMTPPHMVGLSVSVPIWSSGVRATKVRQSKLTYMQTENNIQDTENSLRVQDRQLRYNLTSAIEDYQNQDFNINVSKRVFESITRKYEYGTASSLDVTTASNNLLTAQTNYIQSMMTMLTAQLELKKLINK